MEPFELALSQVNFEGNDLSSSAGQPLHSFGNLVSYDSDFQHDTAGLPVSARRVTKIVSKSSSSSSPMNTLYNSFTDAHSGGPHAHAHLVNGCDSVTVEPDETAKMYYSAQEMDRTSSVGSSPGRKPEKMTDSFKGFTETVEALALQKSVIGNSNITPASAEEIARVIAMTQMKMKDGSGDSEAESVEATTVEVHTTQSATIRIIDSVLESQMNMQTSPSSYSEDPYVSYSEEAAISSKVGTTGTADHNPSTPTDAPDGMGDSQADMSTPGLPGMGDNQAAMPSLGLPARQTVVTESEPGGSESQEQSDRREVVSEEVLVAVASAPVSHQRSSSTSSSELIPVPQDMITKVTEKKGWLTGRSVVSPEQARPKEKLPVHASGGNNSANNPYPNNTAEPDYFPSHVSRENEHVNVQEPIEAPAQSESVIIKHEKQQQQQQQMQSPLNVNVDDGTSGQGSVPDGALSDISGVEKLKGEYDFDTSSYLETMQTFTSLHKTNGVASEEGGAARFSPPVKDPGMLPTHERRHPSHAAKNSKTDPRAAKPESLPELADENLILPFHVPMDTSTPAKPSQGQRSYLQQREQMSSNDQQIVLTEGSGDRKITTMVTEEKIQRTTQNQLSTSSRRVINEDSVSHIDQDITDPTLSGEDSLHVSLTSSHVTHDVSHVTHRITETSSLVVNVDEASRHHGRAEDMTGDLSLGNSSAAAGEGADLTKSERAELYRLQDEVAQLRREKAHLEGKMEVLEREANGAIKDRSELQSHLAAITTQLKSHETNTKTVLGDKNALSADLETLKQNRQRLELVVMDAQKLIEEKDQDLKTLHEDLKLAHAANEKIQEKVKEYRHGLMAKDETVQALKNKVAELYVEYQNSHQARVLAENEIKSLESSVNSLTSAKEWYQAQLQQSQEGKGKLQQEISRIQSEKIASLTLVERLKADNVRIKQSLAEQQQKALQEKELLARHLEAIESDMMEREAAFSQMQQEQVAMESAMKQEEERLRQTENDTSSSEDLKKLQNELRRKQAQVNVLEHEQSQLVKRLTLAQESLLERDRTIDGLDQKYVDVELSYKNVQKELDLRDEEVLRMKNEKNALEIELTSTKEEKKSFDVALHTIKDDMGRVEQGFRQMKQELDGKNEELSEAQRQNKDIDRQLAAARARLRVLTHRSSPQHPQTEQNPPSPYDLAPVHKHEEGDEGLIVKILQAPNEASKPEVVIMTQKESEENPEVENRSFAELDNAVIEQLKAQRDDLEEQLTSLKGQYGVLEHSLTSQEDLGKEVAALRQKLESVTQQYQVATEDRASLENQLVQSKERLLEMELSLRTLTEEKEVLDRAMKEDRSRVESEVASDAREEREAAVQLEKENAMLRSKVAETEKQMSREVNKLRAKVLQVTEEYEARLDEERSRQVDYQAAISELNQRLRQAEQAREQLGAELTASEERFNLSLDEQKLQIQGQTQALTQERQSLEEEQRVVRVQLQESHASLLVREETIEILRTKISEIEVQHREAREQLEESERLRKEEDARRLTLDLEREKGRLAGVMQSHSALKEHATSLEAALARREASVAGLSTHVQGELQKRDKQVYDLRENIKELESEVTKEKQNVKDIKKQLMTEKGQHIKLRRQMETLWVDQDQVKVDLQTRTNDLNLTTLDVEKAKHANKLLKAEVERLTIECQVSKRDLEQLKRDMLEREQQDPLLKERIQTLEWQLQQKTVEVDALREQLQLVGERQTLEVTSLNKALQVANNEITVMKEELVTLRQDKLNQTTKVAQLKSALKASVVHSKKRREQTEAELSKTIPPPFDMAAMERLLQDTAPVSVQSKPLSFLQATLSGLRGEISNLQHEVDQHTSVVQTSSQAWKALEDHVAELREVCKTSAAGRAAAVHGQTPPRDGPAENQQSQQQEPAAASTSQSSGTSSQSKTPIVDV